MRGTLTGMGNGGKLVAAIAGVLLVAGCSSGPADETDVQRVAPQGIEETTTPEPTVEPVTLTAEQQPYLDRLRANTLLDFSEWDDEELIELGWSACAQFDEGKPQMEMTLTGRTDTSDVVLSGLASYYLCTEHDVSKG